MLKTITPIDNSIYVEREYSTSTAINDSLDKSKAVFNLWRSTPCLLYTSDAADE